MSVTGWLISNLLGLQDMMEFCRGRFKSHCFLASIRAHPARLVLTLNYDQEDLRNAVRPPPNLTPANVKQNQ